MKEYKHPKFGYIVLGAENHNSHSDEMHSWEVISGAIKRKKAIEYGNKWVNENPDIRIFTICKRPTRIKTWVNPK